MTNQCDVHIVEVVKEELRGDEVDANTKGADALKASGLGLLSPGRDTYSDKRVDERIVCDPTNAICIETQDDDREQDLDSMDGEGPARDA